MPRDAASLTPWLRHAALVVAALAVLTSARTLHHMPQPPRPLTALATDRSSLDGRLPDGAPAGAVLTARLAGPGGHGEPEESSGARTQVLALAVETPAATPAPTPAVEVRAAPVEERPVVAEAPAPPQPTVTAAPPPAAEVAPPSTRFATRADIEAALATTSWPAELWPRVTVIAFCESGSDMDRDGAYDVVDTHALGAGGRYIGVLQIGADHSFTQQYDLRTLAGNLAAGYELWARAGGSFAPWGCR